MRFVGRAVFVDVLRTALEASAPGRANLVIVEGEPGIGKSALAAHAVAEWAVCGDSRRRLWVKADEVAGAAPFHCILTALRREGMPIAAIAVAPPDQEGDAIAELASARHRLASLIVEEVERLLAEGPLVLVVDDAHWLDGATIGLLSQILRELYDSPLSIFLTIRPLPQPRELAALLAMRDVVACHVVLPPQPLEELEEVLLAHGVTTPVARADLAQAGGNPLYAIELATALAAEGAPSTTGQLPPLGATILRRLGY
ncbi:MAG TPA: ATP-binding protein, partial [Acidimicrobiales bacterium]|nr:ATP-binding protein [Acidimicrobiales bacterium]